MFRLLLITSLVALPLVHTSCTSTAMGPDADPFATYQMCWDEHHTTEGFSVQRAIEICCIDHPIGTAKANVVCGDTAASCQTYVTANLSATSAMASDIMTACTDYVADRAP